MSSELIPLAEAAAKLGISPEKLLELRSNKQIFGVRDGSSWKFKQSELDRVAEDLGLGSGQISDLDTPIENVSDSMDLLEGSDDLLLTDSGSGSLSGSLLQDSDELSLEDSSGPAAKAKGSAKDDLDLMDDDLFPSDELSLQDSAGLDSEVLSSDFVDSSDVVVDDSDSDGSGSEDLMLDDEDLVVSNQGVEDDDFELSDSSILSLDDSGNPDDFDLEPFAEASDDQSSSSQVIALEDSDLMDDSHPTMMAGQSGELLSGDQLGADDVMPLEDFGAAPLGGAAAAAAGMTMVPAEPPYSVLQILSLGSALLFTAALAILSLDLAQNMWQPNDSGSINTVANLLVDAMQFDR